MDELAEDVGVSATELRWVPRQEPPVVELQPLPATRPFRYVSRRTRPLGRFGLFRQVVVEEFDEFGAKRLDPGVESELHTATLSST